MPHQDSFIFIWLEHKTLPYANCAAVELTAKSFQLGSFWTSNAANWTAKSDYWMAKYTFTIAAGKVGYVMATDVNTPSNLVSIWDSTGTIVSGTSVVTAPSCELPSSLMLTAKGGQRMLPMLVINFGPAATQQQQWGGVPWRTKVSPTDYQ
jgi:hypothetical protein